MKNTNFFLLILLLALLAAALFQGLDPAAAADGAGYALAWSSLDGGGGEAQAASGYGLTGTIAQPDAQAWGGGRYRLQGGFRQDWLRYIYLPIMQRN